MTLVIVIVVAVLAIVMVGIVVSRSRPSRDDGVASFQRHLGALSPEARKQVIDRVRKADDQRGGSGGPSDSGNGR